MQNEISEIIDKISENIEEVIKTRISIDQMERINPSVNGRMESTMFGTKVVKDKINIFKLDTYIEELDHYCDIAGKALDELKAENDTAASREVVYCYFSYLAALSSELIARIPTCIKAGPLKDVWGELKEMLTDVWQIDKINSLLPKKELMLATGDEDKFLKHWQHINEKIGWLKGDLTPHCRMNSLQEIASHLSSLISESYLQAQHNFNLLNKALSAVVKTKNYHGEFETEERKAMLDPAQAIKYLAFFDNSKSALTLGDKQHNHTERDKLLNIIFTCFTLHSHAELGVKEEIAKTVGRVVKTFTGDVYRFNGSLPARADKLYAYIRNVFSDDEESPLIYIISQLQTQRPARFGI